MKVSLTTRGEGGGGGRRGLLVVETDTGDFKLLPAVTMVDTLQADLPACGGRNRQRQAERVRLKDRKDTTGCVDRWKPEWMDGRRDPF